MTPLWKMLLLRSASALPASSSIVFNLKAESLALSDGATVSTWVDSSANALSFSGTALFKTNQLGGKPCVRFSGSAGQYLSAARAGTALNTALATQNSTTLMVFKSFGANSNGTLFGSHAGGDSYFLVLNGAAATSSVGRYANGYSLAAPAVNATGIVVVAITSVKPYTAGSGTGLERCYVNGTCVSSNVAGVPAPSQTNFTMGADNGGNLRSVSDIFDTVVWDRALSPTEVFEATSYFYDKYAQTKPWAAVSNITVFDGDSLTQGTGGGGVSGGYPYKSAQSLGLTYGQWTMTGVGGITMANMTAKMGEWTGIGALLGKGMRVAAFEYYNQKALSAATIEANNNAYATAVRALPSTKLALGTSTSSSSDPDATRTSVNAYYDINFATYSDAYVALHNDASVGNATAYATNSATYWSDIVHLNAAGYTVLAGMFTTGLSAIP